MINLKHENSIVLALLSLLSVNYVIFFELNLSVKRTQFSVLKLINTLVLSVRPYYKILVASYYFRLHQLPS
ncbi:hypothetical protein D3C80_802690 [compost metagenome]